MNYRVRESLELEKKKNLKIPSSIPGGTTGQESACRFSLQEMQETWVRSLDQEDPLE